MNFDQNNINKQVIFTKTIYQHQIIMNKMQLKKIK